MYLKTLNLGDIHPYERNPRINDRAVEPVMKSIQKDGYRARIIVDKDGVIIAGHTRYAAMKRMGWAEAEVWIADDMTPEQIADYRIRDNLTADFAEWDFSELEAEIEEMDLDFDMSEFEGFEDIQGEEIETETEVAAEDDFDPDAPVEAKAKLGDVYQLGRHRLMCGDSTDRDEIDRLLDGAFVRLTVTSPPYGVGKDYEKKGIEPWRKTIGGVINAIKGKTLIICWNIIDLFSTGTQFSEPTGAYSIQMFEDAGYGMLYNRIWKKPGANFAGNNPYYTVTTKPAQDYEYLYAFAEKNADKHLDSLKHYLFGNAKNAEIDNAVICSIGGPKYMYGHWFTNHQWAFIDEANYFRLRSYCKSKNIHAFERDYEELRQEYLDNTIFSHALSENDFSEWGLYGVWEFNTVHKRLGGHAAAYPVELPSRFIKMHSYEGNAVLDPFGGTGTTLIACEQLNRTCYMMELDPHYVDVIIARWENLTGEKAVLLNG